MIDRGDPEYGDVFADQTRRILKLPFDLPDWAQSVEDRLTDHDRGLRAILGLLEKVQGGLERLGPFA